MKKLLLFALLLGIAMAPACTKEEDPHNEATIEINSPTEGQVFMQSAPVLVKATLTGVEDLHGYEVIIRKKADGTVLFSKDGHTHGLTLTVEETWTNNVLQHTDIEVVVSAITDHDGTKVSKIVNIHCHP